MSQHKNIAVQVSKPLDEAVDGPGSILAVASTPPSVLRGVAALCHIPGCSQDCRSNY
jgi:hypothetical protein